MSNYPYIQTELVAQRHDKLLAEANAASLGRQARRARRHKETRALAARSHSL